ncbi:MAG TPA: ATP-binding protein [Acidimicrobiia bacterium]
MVAWMSWSTGKDSTLALHVAREELGIEVVALLTSMSTDHDRVSMHAVRRNLVHQQAEQLGLPLRLLELPSPCSNDEYEARMAVLLAEARAEGVERMVFGDLFLEDIRAYREASLDGTGITPIFPLWKRDTSALAREMVAVGIRARVTCVDPRQLDPGFAGREYDGSFLDDLPSRVDPCGERGEFHTFAFDGPGFAAPIKVIGGDVVERDGFVFADLLPGPTGCELSATEK